MMWNFLTQRINVSSEVAEFFFFLFLFILSLLFDDVAAVDMEDYLSSTENCA